MRRHYLEQLGPRRDDIGGHTYAARRRASERAELLSRIPFELADEVDNPTGCTLPDGTSRPAVLNQPGTLVEPGQNLHRDNDIFGPRFGRQVYESGNAGVLLQIAAPFPLGSIIFHDFQIRFELRPVGLEADAVYRYAQRLL